jgi:hypothetical protein
MCPKSQNIDTKYQALGRLAALFLAQAAHLS